METFSEFIMQTMFHFRFFLAHTTAPILIQPTT